MTYVPLDDRPKLGLIAFFIAALALVAVTLHVSGVIDPPKQSTAQTIGQIAAEIRDSAQRALSGQEPAPPPEPARDIAFALTVAVPILAGLATVLAGISLYRGETPTLPKIAIAMGIGAFVMQFVFWLAVVICAFVLLVAVVKNMD
ncbi:MAG: hypothetical protein AAFN59_10590, partial [Pseudomonadota bacterium]